VRIRESNVLLFLLSKTSIASRNANQAVKSIAFNHRHFMDYLVFLTGLFLLASAAGGYFYFREDRKPSRWPMFSLALFALGLKTWFGILTFALELGDWIVLAEALMGAIFAASLLGFCLSPLVHGHRANFVLKWAGIVGLFALTFIVGAGNLRSGWLIVPLIAVSFAGGWRFAGFGKSLFKHKRTVPPIATALLLVCITAIGLLPDAVDICYDIKGQGLSFERIAVLTALAAATVCSITFCVIMWAATYQADRGRLSRNLILRRKIGTSVIFAAAFITVANGAWLAQWLGNQAREEQAGILLSALHLGANNIDARLIDKIQGQPEEIHTPIYNGLRSKLLDIRKALPGNRFTYLLGMRNGQLVFLVDSESPAQTETFSPPGETVKDYPQKWLAELAGNSTFKGPDRDEWGVWFSAAVPIRDSHEEVVALLGVDYPAAGWLKPLAARRVAAMGVTLSAALLLVALFSFHITSIETTRRVESLSERLSDAMTAAEFDTWECFPKPFKLNAGEKISTLLGWSGTPTGPSFRKLWRNIHPDDHYQIMGFIRHQGSSEAQVRLRDANGRWLWFMLRGRAIHAHPDDPIRLVGTILNIDERQRSLLDLDKQRRFAQQIIDSAPNGLAVLGADGVVSYANPALTRMCHSGADELAGRKLNSLIFGMDSVPDADQEFVSTLHGMDGSEIPVQVATAPLSGSLQSNSRVSILALTDLTDITRHNAEASRLALVAKHTDNAVLITDVAGRIEWVNEGFTRISGYSLDEVLGKTPGSILQAPGNLDPARLRMHDCINAGKGFEIEILNRAKSGRAYLVHIECQPLHNEEGKLTGFMAIERDITRSRLASDLLEALSVTSTALLSQHLDLADWNQIVATLGTAAHADRCEIYRVHPHPQSGMPAMSQYAGWDADTPTKTHHPEFQNFLFVSAGLDRWHSDMHAGNEIRGTADSFPEHERVIFKDRGIRSLLLIPIHTMDQLRGFLSFHSRHEDREWQDWEISILRSAATNIGLRMAVQIDSNTLPWQSDVNSKLLVFDRGVG
jgi:PAS domain S-box-containing protein